MSLVLPSFRRIADLTAATGNFDGESVLSEGRTWIWVAITSSWITPHGTYQFGLNGTSTTGELRAINGMGLTDASGFALPFPAHIRSITVSCESSTGNGVTLELRTAQLNGTAPAIDATTPLADQGNRIAYREFSLGELVIPVTRRFYCGLGGTIGAVTVVRPQGTIEVWREFT